MIDKLKYFGKASLIYGLGNVLNRLLGFLLIPIYNNYIAVSEFGKLTVYEISIAFLATIFGYGISQGHQRFFYIEKEKGSYGSFLYSNFIGNLLLTFVSILPLILLASQLGNMAKLEASQAINIRLCMGIVLFEVLFLIPMQVLQYEKKPITFLVLNIVKLSLTLAITWTTVAWMGKGINGIMLARFYGSLGVLIIASLLVVAPRCTFKLDISHLKQTIKFGFPVVISNIGFMLFIINDRYMLKLLSTDAETGKYAFGYKIANFINLIFVQTIGTSFFPSIFSSEKDKDNKHYYRKMLTYYCMLMSVAILGFLFFYKEILSLVVTNEDYQEGLKIVPVLSLFFMVMGMNYFACIGLYLKNSTRQYVIPSFAALLANTGLNLWLIPKHGMMGAAWSTLAAQIINTAILSILSYKLMPIGFEWKKIGFIYTIGIAIFLSTSCIIPDSVQLALILKLLILIVLSGMFLAWFMFENKNERSN